MVIINSDEKKEIENRYNSISDKKKEIIKKYDSTSHFYDKRYLKIQCEKFDIILNDYNLSKKIILDAGCGTGLLLKHMLNSCNSTRRTRFYYIGTDISWNMLMEFRLKMKNNDKASYNLILSDLENLPLRDQTFHSIFSLTSLQNLPNINDGIKELFRVLKNNAVINLSILKKNLKLDDLINVIKPLLKNLKVISENSIEDVFIQGVAKKS